MNINDFADLEDITIWFCEALFSPVNINFGEDDASDISWALRTRAEDLDIDPVELGGRILDILATFYRKSYLESDPATCRKDKGVVLSLFCEFYLDELAAVTSFLSFMKTLDEEIAKRDNKNNLNNLISNRVGLLAAIQHLLLYFDDSDKWLSVELAAFRQTLASSSLSYVSCLKLHSKMQEIDRLPAIEGHVLSGSPPTNTNTVWCCGYSSLITASVDVGLWRNSQSKA